MLNENLKEASIAGVKIFINAKERIEQNYKIKGAEHNYFGDLNFVESYGKAPLYYDITFYIIPENLSDPENSNEQQYRKLQDIFANSITQKGGILLTLPDYEPLFVMPVPNNEIKTVKYRGYYQIKMRFTNALNVFQASQVPNINFQNSLNNVRKDNNSFLNQALNFKNNAFQKVQEFNTQNEEIANYIQGIASNPLQIQGTLNYINTSIYTIPTAVNGFSSSVTNLKNQVLDIPNNITNYVEAVDAMFDNFVNIFSTPESQIDGLLSIGNFTASEPEIPSQSVTAQNIISNNQNLTFLFKVGALTSIYNTINSIEINTKDNLIKLAQQELAIFLSLQGSNFVTDNLINMRNAFYYILLQLLQNSINVLTVEILQPTNLATIIYRYNGNLDFFDETIAVNRLSNIYAVEGKLQILLNQA